MRGRRLVQYAGLAAVLGFCALVPGSAVGADSPTLRGFGTATLDGALSPGEWDSAGHADFTVNRSSDEGGGTVPATIYVMNDAITLYLGLKVSNATVGTSQLVVDFGPRFTEGVDYFDVTGSGTFRDMFWHQVSPNDWSHVPDTDYGGTTDGGEAEGNAGGYSFYEFSHPLNDADDAHDFSLVTPMRISFDLVFLHCASTCASVSRFPGPAGGDRADIVITSGSRVAPETQITSGPADGSVIANSTPEISFTGSDDRIAPADLTFECKLDEDAWRECKSPNELSLDDGKHVASVRAVDEMLNVDASPAQVSFTADTTGPTRPVVRGVRTLRKGRGTLRFTAKDEVTRAGKIRFKCAVDSTHLKRCASVYRVRFRPGRHVLRVRAVDSVGNQSEIATVRVRVTRPRR